MNITSPKPSLILASTSPRRRELIGLIGLPFRAVAPTVDETPLPGEHPAETVTRLSKLKAASVARGTRQEWAHIPIIGADTIVALGDRVIGKPASPNEAAIMLKELRHRPHIVYSGVTVIIGNRYETDLAPTKVLMRNYSDSEIETYIATGSPLDKAGAYGIQDDNFRPVDKIIGCLSNVVGLPLCHLVRLLRKSGIEPPNDVPKACQEHWDIKCQIYRQIIG